MGWVGVIFIFGSDDKWKLCLCLLLCDKLCLEVGVDVLCGMKFCGLLVEVFKGEFCFFVLLWRWFKLFVDWIVLCDEGVMVEDSDRRLLLFEEFVGKVDDC